MSTSEGTSCEGTVTMHDIAQRPTIGRVFYGLVKFVAIFLAVSIVFTLLADLLPQFRGPLEYGLLAVWILMEVWAFYPLLRVRFSLRALFIVTTLVAVVLGLVVWSMQ